MSERNSQRPTLKTIAELTGLSLSTVSLSLRDGSRLSQSTRDKVAKAAKQIGYVPNRAGVRLRTGRTNVLALVLAAEVSALDYTRKLIQGIGAHTHNTPFHLSVLPEFDHSDPVASIQYVLQNQSADGIILNHTRARDERVKLLMDAKLPFVSHGRTEFNSAHAYHDFHAERFAELAVNRLAEKGRRKFALFAINNNTANFSNTVIGFNRAVAAASLAGDVMTNTKTLDNLTQARDQGHSLAMRAERCDAIICNNELTAIGIISGLQEKGLQLGINYDLICKQNTEILPVLYPGIETIAEDLFASGSELARLLIARIDGEPAESLQTLHEPIASWLTA